MDDARCAGPLTRVAQARRVAPRWRASTSMRRPPARLHARECGAVNDEIHAGEHRSRQPRSSDRGRDRPASAVVRNAGREIQCADVVAVVRADARKGTADEAAAPGDENPGVAPNTSGQNIRSWERAIVGPAREADRTPRTCARLSSPDGTAGGPPGPAAARPATRSRRGADRRRAAGDQLRRPDRPDRALPGCAQASGDRRLRGGGCRGGARRGRRRVDHGRPAGRRADCTSVATPSLPQLRRTA